MIDLSKYHNQKCRATLLNGRVIYGTVIRNGANTDHLFMTLDKNGYEYFGSGSIDSIEVLETPKLGRPRLPASERRTPRTAHLTNANWTILEERYGNVTKALEYLLSN